MLHGEGRCDADEFNAHAEAVFHSIQQRDSKFAATLWPVASGFWERRWHEQFRKWEYDKLYGKVETALTGEALLELESMGRDEP